MKLILKIIKMFVEIMIEEFDENVAISKISKECNVSQGFVKSVISNKFNKL